MGQGVLHEYRDFLPVTDTTPLISLGEGDTPLVRSTEIEEELGVGRLFFKLEGCNPTGSFKDRGMVVAVAHAQELGARAILCASTGNTSASAAAYGARCGLPTLVLVSKGNVAQGKMAQAVAYGAHIFSIDGTFDRALELARLIAERQEIALVNSVNPYRLEGQKTASFEIADSLGDAPDYVCIPVGNAGNITAYWKGFREYHKARRTTRLPRMWGFQAEGAAPIVRGAPVPNPQTVASAIRIGNPASWKGAVAARDESGGLIDTVTDDEILDAYKRMARREGIFCEPASAAAVAGLTKQVRLGADLSRSTIVCIITGNGLKDPQLVARIADLPVQEVPADLAALEEAAAALRMGARPR